MRGKWIDPAGGRVLLGTYAERWMADRPDRSNRTREKYAGLSKVHILPAFRHREMGLIEPVAVRGWWAKLAQTRPSTAANAYRLLNTIFRTAVADGQVARNPCQVRAGGAEHAAERPVATVAGSGRWPTPCPTACGQSCSWPHGAGCAGARSWLFADGTSVYCSGPWMCAERPST